MRVYIAARFSLKNHAKELAGQLEQIGVTVTSRWLDEAPMPTHGQEKFLRETAFIDLQDVDAADVLVILSDNLALHDLVPSKWATGSRHFEAGYAFAKGKPIVCVGDRDNLFYHMPNVVSVKNEAELLRYLSAVEVH